MKIAAVLAALDSESTEKRRKSNTETTMQGAPVDPHDSLYCPVNATLNLLNQRWTLHIVRTLLGGKKRFNEIARENGINPRTLRERLRALEEEGVITRTVVTMIPPNVEYSLTPKGETLNSIFEALAEWGKRWMPPPETEEIAL